MSCPLPPSPPIPHPIVCRIPPLVLLYILGLTIHPFWTTDLFTEDSVSRQALHIYKFQKLSPEAPYPCDQFCLFKFAPKIQNLNFQINFSIFFSHISNWINPWLLRAILPRVPLHLLKCKLALPGNAWLPQQPGPWELSSHLTHSHWSHLADVTHALAAWLLRWARQGQREGSQLFQQMIKHKGKLNTQSKIIF